MDSTLALLNSRLEIAKKFTEDFHSEIKRCLTDYKAEKDSITSLINSGQDTMIEATARYQFPVPLIQTNHTAVLGNLFDRPFDLIIRGGGKYDETKRIKIEAAYSYLKKKLNIFDFMQETGWWYVLIGWCSSRVFYKKEGRDEMVIGRDGQPLLNEAGSPVTRFVLTYDDPVLTAGKPEKEYYSPESEFSVDGKKVPYMFWEELMTKEVVEKIYEEEVETDASLETKAANKKDSVDLKRVNVRFYLGTLTKEAFDDLIELKKLPAGQFDPECAYFVVSTKSKVVHAAEFDLNEKQIALAKWQGTPADFFGFGVGKQLRFLQLQKSIRRSQQLRHADTLAFVKPIVEEESNVDTAALMDPRSGIPVLYKGQKPEYLVPPGINDAINFIDSTIDRDAQQVSGMIDIAAGSQAGGTVETATGQTLFASELDKRMKICRSRYAEFYKRTMILALKQCANNWSAEKIVTIMDERGKQQDVAISQDDLQDIDWDKDIDIDVESATVNKDLIRSQLTELYNILKDDPKANREEILKDLMRDGYGRKNPERYLADSKLEPGMNLVNPETGEQFVVDDSGQVVAREQEDQTADPTGSVDVPSDASALMGAAQ